MRFKTYLGMALSAMLLSGCAGMELQKAEKAQPKGTDFSKALYSGYLDLSKSEYGEGDFSDSDTFAKAALAAASGTIPAPQEMTSRRLPENKVAELGSARGRLVTALSAGAGEKMPAKAANAQVMFDCWMQEQEENFQPKDIERCRADFMTAVADLEAGMKPIPVAAKPAPVVKAPPMKVAKATELRYFVYFPFNSTDMTPDSNVALKTAIDAAQKLKGAKIQFIGHADTAGQQNYNFDLSKRRIETVMDAMKQNGVTASAMNTAAYGETKLPVATPDNTPNAMNRRVQIVIRK